MVSIGSKVFEVLRSVDDCLERPSVGVHYQVYRVEDRIFPHGFDEARDSEYHEGKLDAHLVLVGGDVRVVVEEAALQDALATKADYEFCPERGEMVWKRSAGRWRTSNPRLLGPDETLVHPDERDSALSGMHGAPRPGAGDVLETTVAPRKASDLTFQRESGRGSQSEVVFPFLDGNHDGCVFHGLDVPPGWKFGYTARGPEGDIISAAVIGRPSARALDDGETLQLTRLANHPARPSNTSSWMLARMRDWLTKETEYETLVTYAGASEGPGGTPNTGTCYEAAGFTFDQAVGGDGQGWNSASDRDGRAIYADGGEWERRRYSTSLTGGHA